MLFGLIAILICSVFFTFYRFTAKSWYSNQNSTWWAQRELIQHSTDDTSQSKMGPAKSSEKRGIQESEFTSPELITRASSVEGEAGQTTPKARPAKGATPQVPSFTLDMSSEELDDEDNLPPPSFPAFNSAQRASGPANSLTGRGEPSKLEPLSNAAPGDRQLMPPPRLPPPRQAIPSGTGSLRIPTTGPLPNRGPPARSSNSLAPPPYKVTNMRQKVALTPGHSPLDWAALQRSNKNLSGVNSFIRVTPSQLKAMNGRKGKPAWSSYQGKVYNITPYLPYHPGGEGELRRAAGKDGEKLFLEVHPWVNWDNMLGECLVGIMISEGDTGGTLQSSLDDMD